MGLVFEALIASPVALDRDLDLDRRASTRKLALVSLAYKLQLQLQATVIVYARAVPALTVDGRCASDRIFAQCA